MDLGKGPILVTGATGRQGGAVARHLLQHGFEVHALTRRPLQPEADQLRKLGATVVAGDMDDPESIKPLMQNVLAVFSVQNFWEVGAEREVAEGRLVADLAQAHGLKFIVYSSVGGAERSTGIAHFESKYRIEEHIRSLPLSWSVLRPVWFMENLLRSPQKEQIEEEGVLAVPMPPDVALQMVSVNDVGAIAAMAFMEPTEWASRSLEIAGDERTMPEVAAALSDHLGRKVEYQQVPIEQVRAQSEDAAVMYEWFVTDGYEAPIDELRLLHPGLLNLEQWLCMSWPVRAPAQ
jgi:uncharacterized protein YbjT (DUF2867 family)